MAQLAIYLDSQTAALLDDAAKREGLSRSAWVRQVIESRLLNRWPESFLDTLGSWEGDEDSEQILQSVRKDSKHQKRAKIK